MTFLGHRPLVVSVICLPLSFTFRQRNSKNPCAAYKQKNKPEPQRAIITGLSIVTGLRRNAYIVIANVALVIRVFVLVSCSVSLVAASALVPVVILVGLPISAVLMAALDYYAVLIGGISEATKNYWFILSRTGKMK